MLIYANGIIEYGRKRPGLSNAPLDRSYDNHGMER